MEKSTNTHKWEAKSCSKQTRMNRSSNYSAHSLAHTHHSLPDVPLTASHLMSKWLWFPFYHYILVYLNGKTLITAAFYFRFIEISTKEARVFPYGLLRTSVQPKVTNSCDKVVKSFCFFPFKLFLLFAAFLSRGFLFHPFSLYISLSLIVFFFFSFFSAFVTTT